jgi:hypothetical protein
MSGLMPRAAEGAQSIPPRITQNAPRPEKFTAPHGLERLLEELFLPPAVNIAQGRVGAAVGDALRGMHSSLLWLQLFIVLKKFS